MFWPFLWLIFHHRMCLHQHSWSLLFKCDLLIIFLGSSRRIRSLVSLLKGKFSNTVVSYPLLFPSIMWQFLFLVLFSIFKVWHLLAVWFLDMACSRWLGDQQSVLQMQLNVASGTLRWTAGAGEGSEHRAARQPDSLRPPRRSPLGEQGGWARAPVLPVRLLLWLFQVQLFRTESRLVMVAAGASLLEPWNSQLSSEEKVSLQEQAYAKPGGRSHGHRALRCVLVFVFPQAGVHSPWCWAGR